MKRLFEDDGSWSWLARRTTNEITIMLKDVLNRLEHELEDPADLRDFHYIANFALGGFTADLSLARRIGNGDEYTKAVIEDHPRLYPYYDDEENSQES